MDNEDEKIYSCYTLNNKILECVKELNLIDECIKTLKGENGNTNDDDLSLEITNFPRLTQNNPQINNINNYLEINKYFENEDKKKKITNKIKDDDKVVKKVYDYVLSNALKKGLNEVDFFSRKDGDLRNKLKGYTFLSNEEKKEKIEEKKMEKKDIDKLITADNFFINELKDYVEDFLEGFKKFIIFFELEV